MKTYKYKRRIRKIKKFGKKLGIALIFLVVSYLLSLFSFYLYTQLSQILHPEEKGFLGFALIGLIAGFIALLVSLVNKRLILTVVISFFIDCLVNSIFLFSKLGVQVLQFLPGLLVSMSTVIASWHFLKRKLGLPKNYNQTTQGTKEQVSNKYALARKLIENPNKITLEVFKEACELLQGIDPKIDAVLKEADHVSRALTFLNGGDAIGLAVSCIKVKTEKDEEKKEKLLFFIDLVNDIREEVSAVMVKIDTAKAVDTVKHQNMAPNTIIAASGPSNIVTVSMAIVVATSVIATNTAGIGLLLPNNEFQIPITQNSQETTTPLPTATSKNLPTDIPKTVQILTFSTIEKTIFVSALEEGITFTANSTGTYRFTITGGASETSPTMSQPNRPETWGWNTRVLVYKNRPIDWSGPSFGWGTTPINWNYSVGDPNFKPTSTEAERVGKGKYVDIPLLKGEYMIFLVPDSKGDFVDNSGGVYLQVQKAIVSEGVVLTSYAECSVPVSSPNQNYLNIFGDGNNKTRPLSNTVELSSGKSYWIRMSIGFEGNNGEAEAIANKNNTTFSVTLNGNELKLSGDTKIEYYNFWEIKGYYCTGILAKGSHKIVGTSYLGGNYVDSASLTLIAK